REGVVWFGTDRGVCRFDRGAPQNEAVGTDAESNFVRALYRDKNGELLCGTNRGLFVYDAQAKHWRALAALARKTVYALAEDAPGRLLVGTSSGLYVGVSTKPGAVRVQETVAPEEEGQGAPHALPLPTSETKETQGAAAQASGAAQRSSAQAQGEGVQADNTNKSPTGTVHQSNE